MDLNPLVDQHGRYEHDHPVFLPPEDPDATIWRYIDFTKLVSLLDTKRLFFAPAAIFDDPFEGSYPTPNLAAREKFWAEHFPGESPPFDRGSLALDTRKWTFINSWNLSEIESAAFWRLYVPSSGGVALRSTFRRLTESFVAPAGGDSEEKPDLIHIGKVQYVDYDQAVLPEWNGFYPYVHKRQSFAFEAELRAVMMKFPLTETPEGEKAPLDFGRTGPAGLRVSVDLERLIGAIHVSPYAPSWFAALVESVVGRYDCGATVRQSSLSAQPVF
jgi:hypothetical protein